MRLSWKLLFVPVLLSACATRPFVVATADDTVVTLDECADDLAGADVVVLGEMHGTEAVHRTHHALIAELHERRPHLAVAMEMFERDTQTTLLQYLTGFLDESGFLARARPWPRYATDYRPVVEFAREHGLVVIAANAPRALARKVASEGLGAVAGEPHVARETSTPEDESYDAFVEAMQGHPGISEAAMQRMYAAQCLKDDTMAESVTDHIAERRAAGERPLVVLLCGKMHSDHRRGVVQRMVQRLPDLDVRVLSVEAVDDLSTGIYSSPRTIGDYVVVVEEQQRAERTAPPLVHEPVAARSPAAPAQPASPTTEPTMPTMPPAGGGEGEGLRPALGLMPDYDATGDGVLVGMVRPGGPAETAGIEPGDVIVALAGTKITDVQHYSDLLDQQTIGKTVPVLVRRESAEVELRVKIGSRSR